MDHIGFSSALYCSDRSVFNWNQTFKFSNGKKRPILQCRRYILFDFLIIFLFPLYVSVTAPPPHPCAPHTSLSAPIRLHTPTHTPTHQQPSKFSLPESEPEPHSLKSLRKNMPHPTPATTNTHTTHTHEHFPAPIPFSLNVKVYRHLGKFCNVVKTFSVK